MDHYLRGRMKSLLAYIDKKSLLQMMSLVTLQQVSVAFSTFALAKAGLAFDDRRQFVAWILLSLVVFLLTPLFGVFIRRLESRLGLRAYGIFLDKTLFSKSGISSLWQNKTEKDRFLASIGSDANDYLALMLFISMDIYSFSLSVVLGVLVLGLAIDLSLIPAFVIAGISSFIIYRWLSPSVEKMYNREQSARTELSGHLLKCWDNILLNNASIHRNYQTLFHEKMQHTLHKTMVSATRAETLIFILGLAAGLPILGSICWILWDLEMETQKNVLIALLATLPRQLNILGVFRNIFQSLTSLLGIKAKFDVIYLGTSLRERNLRASINASEITFGSHLLQDISSLELILESKPKGRFEVRGPNGSGKSTLLLYLNQILPSSFYLPSHPDLILSGDKIVAKSTGENLLAHIEYIKSLPEDIILLDEWDANLDHANLLQLENEIQILSQNKTIIEVRHRPVARTPAPPPTVRHHRD